MTTGGGMVVANGSDVVGASVGMSVEVVVVDGGTVSTTDVDVVVGSSWAPVDTGPIASATATAIKATIDCLVHDIAPWSSCGVRCAC